MKLFMCSTSSGEQVLTLNKIIKKQKQGKVVKIIRQIDELKKNGSKWLSVQKTKGKENVYNDRAELSEL